MRSIVFDTGPVISLATNSLLWLLRNLKGKYDGSFYLPMAVKKELIDRPLASKKFKLEALQVMATIRDDVLEVVHSDEMHNLANELMDLANRCFAAWKNPLRIVHYAEMEALAAVIVYKSDALIVDERVTRFLIEDSDRLRKLLEHRLHVKVKVNKASLAKFQSMVKEVSILRSIELVMRAYEFGMLDNFVPKQNELVPEPKKMLLQALLWGLKLRGASISRREIDEIVKVEKKI